VNDNVVDLTINPGKQTGAPAEVSVSPPIPWLRFENKIITGAPETKPDIHHDSTEKDADGTLTVSVTGTIPMGGKPYLAPYAVPDPVRFAEALFAKALADKGVVVKVPRKPHEIDFDAMKVYYTSQNTVAEQVSSPLSEEVKVTLKVSQNLHASMTPYILGAILGHAREKADAKGFELEREFLQKAGLDLTEASQADGAGGAQSAFFTPDFMVHYLAYMAQQSDFDAFHSALPILGRDGTLAKIQVDDPAAGHVFAKTGTYGATDLLNNRLMLLGKGLAGYMTTSSGQHLAFAFYVNHVSLPRDHEAVDQVAGQALGTIAAAAWRLPIDRATLDAQ
jgi:D-alanyl-D-alanine carboxypeptidase/D-alanyl-D-alanine-endopeptidase (penicillin-binding protein 4)